MAAGNVISGLRFGALIAAISGWAGGVNAQEGAAVGRGSFGVPLQPFSLRETYDDSPRAEPIRVAYYAPRSPPAPVPRAAAAEEDNDDATVTHDIPTIR